MALGVTADELASAETTPLVRAALLAFTHLATNLPWLGGLTASHFLERRNNTKLVKGGGASFRWRDRLVNELGIEPELLISTNVHVEADEDHSDMIEDAIVRHVTDEESYKAALDGARECIHIDRAYRGAVAHGMRAIDN
jgi:pyrroloquinoline quinone (PQQ) biosynthesis protein C